MNELLLRLWVAIVTITGMAIGGYPAQALAEALGLGWLGTLVLVLVGAMAGFLLFAELAGRLTFCESFIRDEFL